MKRVLIAVPLVLIACPSGAPPAKTPTPAPSVSIVPSSSAKPPTPVGSSEVPTVMPEGAAVKAPIFSDDDCNADSDCAPLATCHPDRCVASGKTGTLAAGTMCTMECRGGTLDCNYNHCGCAAPSSGKSAGKKKCAVLPGPASPH